MKRKNKNVDIKLAVNIIPEIHQKLPLLLFEIVFFFLIQKHVNYNNDILLQNAYESGRWKFHHHKRANDNNKWKTKITVNVRKYAVLFNGACKLVTEELIKNIYDFWILPILCVRFTILVEILIRFTKLKKSRIIIILLVSQLVGRT